MLNYQEEIELCALRERHLACLIGSIVAIVITLFFLGFGLTGGPCWTFAAAAVDALIGLIFFAHGRAPLRRIRYLEEFR